AGDINGDGFADLIVGSPGGANGGTGAAYVLFGRPSGFAATLGLSSLNGTNGFCLDGVTAGDKVGWSVSSAGDVNGDGLADLIIGAPGTNSNTGSAYVIFGKTGGFTATFNLASLDGHNGFRLDGVTTGTQAGVAVSSAGDVNGDGFDDLLIGAPGANGSGSSYVLFGQASGFASVLNLSTLDGHTGFRLDGVTAGDNTGGAVSAAGDVNGDGFADLIIGAKGANGGAGYTYVVYGSDSTGGVDFLGTSTNHTLTGTSAAEVFVAGSASDTTMTGGGGADVFHGGAGNDTIVVADTTFRLVDGGNGTDTLALSGANMVLELAARRGHIQSIEKIDLTGSGNNTLILTALDLLDLSDSTNTLTVNGNAGDVVNAGAGWTDGGVVGGYHVYTQGQAVLDVATAITNVVAMPAPASVISLATLNGSNGFRLDGAATGNQSGYAVHSAGDVNNDGLDDLIIGAPAANGCNGYSYVVFGQASGFASTVSLASLTGSNGFRLDGNPPGGSGQSGWSGFSVGSVGDINGDGKADLIIGADFDDGNSSSIAVGTSYVLFGKASGFASSAVLSTFSSSDAFHVVGIGPGDRLGWSVSSAGDINGDGFADLIAGSIGRGNYTGASYVVFGHASGSSFTPNLVSPDGTSCFRLDGTAAGDRSGYSVSSAGDINGDGFADLIVGSPGGANGGTGAAYVLFGRPSGFAATLGLSSLNGTDGFCLDGVTVGDRVGWSVSSAGDVNGDGLADLIIGAPGTNSSTGSAYVIFGKAGSFTATFNLASLDGHNGFRLDGVTTGAQSGISVSSAGDVNGDGFDDLLIGASGPLSGAGGSGAAYVVFGQSSGFAAVLNLSTLNGHNGFRLSGATLGDQAGFSVSAAGDVNGDGFADVMIGAKGANGGAATGSSYILYGSDSTGGVDFLGTSTNHTLTGTSAAEVFVAGSTSDTTLIGGGGADVFHGGAGNDTIVVADTTFRLVDGGNGTDTLALAGTGLTLNLTTERGHIQSIEVINLTGSGTGGNTLLLTALDVLNLSDTTNILTIDGDETDIVRGGTGWTDGGVSGGYHIYTKGQAELHIAAAVTFCQGDPLVLDLTGNGIHLTGQEAGTHFDMNGDGVADPTGWIGPGNGLLVWDQNGNGQIDGMQEVISEHTAPNATSSLAALATLDSNHDGKIDASDPAFAQLQVWVDQNHDGISTLAELHTLSQLGITALGLTADHASPLTMNGNTITGFANVTYADGHQGTMAEVQLDFSVAATTTTPATDTTSPAATPATGTNGTNNTPPDYSHLADILNWEGVALHQVGDTVQLVDNGSSLDLTNLLANKALAGVDKVDMTGAGNNTLSVHDFLDFSGSDHPFLIKGDAGDVVNVQQAINVMLGANTTVVVDGVGHATDASGHTTIGADTYVVHQTVDGLHTVLVGGEVVVNFLK
ncbi:MAG: FG-GAP repeat protein, partial [Magnetococcales bacterium]|nr:FG-GAP repeat protein [Magnetococcales bacterium]